MRCRKCEFDNQEGAKFCGNCGDDLARQAQAESDDSAGPQVKCSRCGASMPAKAVFCGICGTKLQESKPEEKKRAASDPTQGSAEPTLPKPTEPAPKKTAPPPAATEDERREAVAEISAPEGSIREMVLVPEGWFAMGSRDGTGNQDEQPRHQVQLSAYYIDRHAVSNSEYERFDPNHRRLRDERSDGDHDPVVFVSFQDCVNYCRWRAKQEGVAADSYSLPTEAQWERAARGGYPDRLYPWGDEIFPEACNSLETNRNRTVPVDEGLPNGFFLFHMGCNVREWCLDRYSATYYQTAEAKIRDPVGPKQIMFVNMCVVRGASFQDLASELGRCAARNYAHPKSSSNDIGFRCVRKAST